MQEKSENYSMQEILRLAKSPAGQAILQLLQEQHKDTMQSVVKSAQEGQMDKASENLAQFLRDPRARALLQRLQEEENG